MPAPIVIPAYIIIAAIVALIVSLAFNFATSSWKVFFVIATIAIAVSAGCWLYWPRIWPRILAYRDKIANRHSNNDTKSGE